MPEVVRILRLAAGGEGIGHLSDGRTAFVPRTAPGDLVELADVRYHRRFARGRIGRIVEASSERVEPRCPHYVADDCGGCQMQHLSAGAQQEARRAVVGDALRRIAKRPVEDPAIVPAERPYEYRAKLTLAVTPDGRRAGFHRQSRPNEIFNLERCHIARPELMALWQAVRAHRMLWPKRLDRIVLRLDRVSGRHVVFRTMAAGDAWDGGRTLHEAVTRTERGVTIWWQPEGGAARAMAGAAEAFPITAFEQVHPEMGDRVRAFALEALGDVSGRHVWDLYAGIGETTASLVRAGASVESVEADRQAVKAAEADGPPARRHIGRVESVLGELRRPDLAITNPPRVGMHDDVSDALERSRADRIVYISCDPATLARDLLRLPAYRIADVRAFDLFPQTAHVETVVTLERI